MKHRRLLGVVIVAVLFAWFLLTLFLVSYARSTTPPPSTTTVPVATTTTTAPFANLRASLDDYCGAKHRGHALIIVKNGAPIGGCSG